MDRKHVENTLLKIGIPAGVKGFKYITDTVLLLDKREIMSATKELYPAVGEINGTTGTRVERAIRHAFETARSPKGNYEAVEHYIGFMNCQNINSLRMLYTRIKNETAGETRRETKENKAGLTEEDVRKIVQEEVKAIMRGIL